MQPFTCFFEMHTTTSCGAASWRIICIRFPETHESPPTEALEAWRRLLAPTLADTSSRAARESESKLLEEARRIAKMDERPMDLGASIDPGAGITSDEQRVLDELAAALGKLPGAQ